MRQTLSAPRYDVFKLIVALILLALLIILLLRLPAAAASETAMATEPAVALPAASATSPAVAAQLDASPTAVEPTSPPPAEPTLAPTTTPTLEPTSTPTLAPTPTEVPVQPTATPEPAEAAATPAPAEATPTATAAPAEAQAPVEPPADDAACAALPTRLEVGSSVSVTTNLHFRAAPGMEAERIRTHTPGTIMEVIGGPQCIAYQGGAYRWWQLEHADGTTGWSAEGSLAGGAYFLQPVE